MRTKTADLSVLLEDSPRSYYWIGFLLADGTINERRIKLTLAAKDAEHVAKFASFIKYAGNKKHHNSVAAMNRPVVEKFRSKFGIENRKTYYPASLEWIKDNDLFLSLFCGYVDGDGCIRKLSRRNDSHIVIKVHSSWLPVLEWMRRRLEKIFEVSLPASRINKKGYAQFEISRSAIVGKLKQRAMLLSLPLLERKWILVNERYVNRNEIAFDRLNQVRAMLEKDVRKSEIAKCLGVTKAAITLMVKRNGLQKTVQPVA